MGLFFLHFDINLNRVSVLPSFVGVLLFLSAIRDLCEEERELGLLRPLGIILAIWDGMAWLASWTAIDLDGIFPAIDVIIRVVQLYFHFQFLTNLASIAAKYQSGDCALDEKLLRYRTWYTIMLTAIVLMSYMAKWLDEIGMFLSFCMMLVCLIAGVMLMRVLFALQRCLLKKAPD